MSCFAQRQAALVAQVLGDLIQGTESCEHNISQDFLPCHLPLTEHEQHFSDINFCAPVLSSGQGGVNNGVPNVTTEWWEQGGFGFESLAEQVPTTIAAPGRSLFHAVDEDEDHARLEMPVWNNQPVLSEMCCREPPVKRPRNGSFYTLDDILKKQLPRCAPEIARHSEEEKPQLQIYPRRSYVSLEPQSIAARERRIKIREKILSLEKLIPQGSKLDMSRKLEEAYKYIKFLQAQVRVLQCMPQGDSKSDLKSNPNSAMENARNLSLRSHASSSRGMNSSFTNSLALQRSACLFNKLSTQQMLNVLVTSPTIQRKLFTAERVICTVQQKELLGVSSDFSNCHSD